MMARVRSAAAAAALVAVLVLAPGCSRTISPAEQLSKARSSLQAGDYAAANSEIQSLLAADAGNAAARLLRAQLMAQIGDFAGAQDDLSRASSAGAAPADVVLLRYEVLLGQRKTDELLALSDVDQTLAAPQRLRYRAQAYDAAGRYAEADAAFAAALKLAPEDPQIQLARARSLISRGAVEDARALLVRLTQLKPVPTGAWLLLAYCESAAGRIAEARKDLQFAIDSPVVAPLPDRIAALSLMVETTLVQRDFAAAQEAVHAIEKLSPASALVSYMRGRVAIARGNYPQALAHLQLAVRAAPDHVPTRLLFVLALQGQGSTEQAEAELGRLLAEHPENLEARKMLARMHLQRNRTAEARRLLEQAPTGVRGDAETDWMLGNILLGAGESEAGVARLERSVDEDPADVARRLSLARIYISAGASAKAIETLQSVPESVGLRQRRGMLLLARVAGKKGEEARQQVDGWLAEGARDAASLITAGGVSLQMGETDRGLAFLHSAVEVAPDSVEALLVLSGAQLRLGHPELAEPPLKRALEIDARNQVALMSLARIAIGRGDLPGAAGWLERAVGSDPQAVEPRMLLASIAMNRGEIDKGRSFLQQAVQASGNSPRVAVAAAQMLVRARRAGDAVALLVAMPNVAAAPELVVALGKAQLLAGNQAEGRRVLQQGQSTFPADLGIAVVLAQLDAKEGRLDNALTRLDALVGAGAAVPAVNELRGDVLMISRQYAKAAARYETALAAAPADSLLLKAFEANRLAGAGQSVKPLQDWLLRHPESVPVRMMLGQTYVAAGAKREAVAQYEALLARDPRHAGALNNLAWLYQELGDDRSVETAARAYALAPMVPAVADTYGWVLTEHGRAREGLPILKKAAAAAPQDADLQYHLAAAYSRTGDNAMATKLLKPILASGTTFGSRAGAQQLLSQLAPNALELRK